MSLPREGGCFCGAVRYRAAGSGSEREAGPVTVGRGGLDAITTSLFA
jgi:hypothetical protein